VPRILVADDNSNIQRSVTLALQGEGIEVVAVGNGEAAIRKLPDIAPDLVLADIFMPVRNGYEVCEFIKHDRRYSHIPVVLLVGAFDPLDEIEAQRVSADGILKKPFVPPDPLVGMVKTLLSKSATERLVAVAVPVAVSAGEAHTHPDNHAATRAAEPPVAEFSDTETQEFPAMASGVDIGRNEKPMAFSPILEIPAADDADLAVTAQRDPSLGEPSWSQAPAAVEPVPQEGTEETADHFWGNPPLPAIESAAVESPVTESPVTEGIVAPEAYLPEMEDIAPGEWAAKESAEPPPLSSPEMDLSLPEQAAILPPLERAPARHWWEAETTKPSTDEPAAGQNAVSQDLFGNLDAPEVAGSHVSDSGASQDGSLPAGEALPAWLAPLNPISPGSESLWASAQEALTETQEVTPMEPGPVELTTAWPPAFEPIISSPSAASVEPAAPAVEPEPIPDEVAAVAPAVAAPLAEPISAEPTPPNAELVEAAVARIIELMQPKILDVVTREILRPVVEALVRREIDKRPQ